MTRSFGPVDVKWYGHASLKFENSNGFTVYVDPWSEVMTEPENEKKADVIVNTHEHFDHFDERAINSLRDRDTAVLSAEEIVENIPDQLDTYVIRPEETVEVKDNTFKGVEAYNTEDYREPDEVFHPRGLCTGVIFELDGVTLYHASDTDPIEEMKELQDENIDVALLPVGGHYTMNQDEALEAIKMIEPEKVVPIHYGYIDETTAETGRFKKDVKEKTDAEPVVMNPGP